MTENEMLKIAVHCLGVQAEQEVCEECPVYRESGIVCKEIARTVISALEEAQRYRAIGTVEECRKAVEKQKPKKCDVTKDNFRIYYKCPTCNHCLRVEYNHGSWMGKKSKNCSKCGQAIQWEGNLEGMEDE